MGFWSSWFGNEEAPKPSRVTLIPDVLSMFVEYSEEDSPTLEVTSDGLRRHNQAELSFAVQHRETDNPEALLGDLADFLRTVDDLASQGRIVEDGDLTEFGERAFLAPEVGGIVYAQNAGRLWGILVKRDEIPVVKMGGAHRVLTRLGAANSHYPFPTTSDLHRASVSHQDAEESSVLAGLPTAKVAGLAATLRGKTLELTAAPRVRAAIAALLPQIPANMGVGFLTSPSQEATGSFVWSPGQDGAGAITAPGTTGESLCGWVLVIAPEQPTDHIRLIEDGFGLLLQDATWERLRAALRDGDELAIQPDGDSFGLRLSWLPDVYVNPVDGTRLTAEGGWKTYQPQGREPVEGQRIVLLSDEQALERAISTERLSAYIKTLFLLMVEARGSLSPELVVQVDLEPSRPPQFTGKPEQPLPETLSTQIGAVKAPTVTEPIAFQLILAALAAE